jgi:hypothetical protein
VCGSTNHFARKCPDRKMPKSANVVVSEGGGTFWYGKFFTHNSYSLSLTRVVD